MGPEAWGEKVRLSSNRLSNPASHVTFPMWLHIILESTPTSEPLTFNSIASAASTGRVKVYHGWRDASSNKSLRIPKYRRRQFQDLPILKYRHLGSVAAACHKAYSTASAYANPTLRDISSAGPLTSFTQNTPLRHAATTYAGLSI